MQELTATELCHQLDMLGPCADLGEFTELFEIANSVKECTPEIAYFVAFVITRTYIEVGPLIISCNGNFTGDYPTNLFKEPLDVLLEMLDRDLELSGSPIDYNFFKGICDARFLYEMLKII